MRIVFTLHHAAAFRYLEEVVRYLCREGHRVQVLLGDVAKPITVDRGLRSCQEHLKNLTVERMLFRQHWRKLSNLRELNNYINYLRPEHPTPGQAWRWRGKIDWPVRKLVKQKWLVKLLSRVISRQSLHRIESLIPPDRAITDWLSANKPDVVVASPYIFPLSMEVEYVKAARALGIPTIVVVMSWDNLTTKGTFHVVPERTLVWNEALAEEAEKLHDVPRSKIIITGAPPFDFWFTMEPSLDFSGFARQVQIDPMRPFILYLCSSQFIAENEHQFVSEFAETIKANPGSRDISIVVRPHPLNASIWRDFKADGITIWPQGGEWVDVPRAKQDYYNTIFHSKAVVGVNTSAFLEAAILDKPCITVLTEKSRAKQSGLAHFRHLLNAGFLEIATSYAQAASIIAEIVTGKDLKQVQRQKFVQDFIRPMGMDKSASIIAGKTIEGIAMGSFS